MSRFETSPCKKKGLILALAKFESFKNSLLAGFSDAMSPVF
jgi:hypothetical protein